jgi:hypothetical protein
MRASAFEPCIPTCGPRALVRGRFPAAPSFAVIIYPALKVLSSNSAVMTDRRATTRQRVFKSGAIEFDGKGIECIIRNVSPTGAALDVPSPAGIPHEITVNFIAQNIRQRGYIVWRKEKRVGVFFV